MKKFLDPLYKNSLYLLIGNAIATISGFLFWILVARIYSTAEIGLGTSLSSLVGLITSLSLLGLNTGLLRFLPTSTQKTEKINSSIVITAVVSGILAVVFLSTLPEPLLFVRENPVYAGVFILVAIITTLNALTESIFIAFRATIHVLIKAVIHSTVKLILPFVLISFGAFGIFGALSMGTLGSLLYALKMLAHKYQIQYAAHIDRDAVKKMASISFATYISGLITSIPSYILPVFITTHISPTQTAYYYVAATTANVLFIIPLVITQNLLVEGSYDEAAIKQHTNKASLLIGALLIPAITIMFFFGDYILLVFGKQYSTEGIMLLRLLSLSGIFVGANYIFGTLLTIYQHMRLLIAINTVGSITLLGGSYLLLSQGIVGIGYATLLTQAVLLLLYIISFVTAGGYKKEVGRTSKTS